jgi:hypothetical protein
VQWIKSGDALTPHVELIYSKVNKSKRPKPVGAFCYDTLMKLLEIDLPQYNIQQEPDSDAISQAVDDVIRKEFFGKSVVVRGIASSEHPDKTVDELIDIISKTGTDKYDPSRKGDRYENVENKHIDLFGVPATVSDESEIFKILVWGFYHSAKAVHGYPVRIDIAIVYDADQLEQVVHRYEGRDDIKDDGFAFKNSENKAAAVLGIIKIT